MQRMIEATLVNKILNKYENRLEECRTKWDADYQEMQGKITADRMSFVVEDMNLVNVQIGAYECIVKDLKELIK